MHSATVYTNYQWCVLKETCLSRDPGHIVKKEMMRVLVQFIGFGDGVTQRFLNVFTVHIDTLRAAQTRRTLICDERGLH